MLDKAGSKDDIENGIANARGQRIAAKRRPMRAGSHSLRGLQGRKKSTKGKSAADALGNRHDVRHDAKKLIGKQLASPADARLHFVEQQKQAIFVAKFAQRPQKARRRHPDAALALYGFDQNGAGLWTNGSFDRLDVGKRNRVEAFDRRTKTFKIFGISRGS